MECGRISGFSIITAVLQNKSQQRKSYLQEPFDILYGFRGTEYNVDVLSPYEMLLFWRPVSIHAPLNSIAYKYATWTKEGMLYKKQCSECNESNPKYIAGKHYIAKEADDRILMPEILHLSDLRHKWCWERRRRLHLPVWSFSKIPKGKFSPEENCLLYTSPSPRDLSTSRMPSSA